MMQLFEARRNSIILVDFQPAYQSDDWGYNDAIEEAVAYINKAKPHYVTCFYNGQDVGIEDTQHEVAWHYMEHGLDEDRLRQFTFREKSYAFLRNWMDQDIANSTIIRVIRHLVMNNMNDSREIDLDTFQTLTDGQFGDENPEDAIYIPDINMADLRKLSGSLIGGGGRHECLKELQLFMNAFNIKYKQVEEWTYG
jgi:hypothetical protein